MKTVDQIFPPMKEYKEAEESKGTSGGFSDFLFWRPQFPKMELLPTDPTTASLSYPKTAVSSVPNVPKSAHLTLADLRIRHPERAKSPPNVNLPILAGVVPAVAPVMAVAAGAVIANVNAHSFFSEAEPDY